MKKSVLFFLSIMVAAAMCAGLTFAAEPKAQPEAKTAEAPLLIADAAMYRGAVTEVEQTKDGTVVSLEQAKGTDFGADSMRFLLGADTKLSFEIESLAVGGYLEVFYGVQPGEKADVQTVIPAISAKLYASAEMVNFNGTLEQVVSGQKEGTGKLVLTDLESGQTVIFNYSEEDTQIYLNLGGLQTGDRLNIFHRGIFTRSLPPQGSPLEIRRMAEPAASFIGVIEEISGSSAVVWVSGTEGGLRRGDRVIISLAKAGEPLLGGDKVRVGYDGELAETYPIQVDAQTVERIDTVG